MGKYKTGSAILLGMLLFGGVARAESAISDKAGFFSKEAVERADHAFAAIARQATRSVRLRTFVEIPSELQPQFKAKGKESFYDQWAMDLLRAEKADVLILMTRTPRRLQIATSGEAEKSWLPVKARDAMRDEMLALFRKDQFDEGLSYAARYLTEHSPATQPKNAGSSDNSK